MENRVNRQYSRLKIDPIVVIIDYDLPYCEGMILKIITRYKLKKGEEKSELMKAENYCTCAGCISRPINRIPVPLNEIEKYVRLNKVGKIEEKIIYNVLSGHFYLYIEKTREYINKLITEYE